MPCFFRFPMQGCIGIKNLKWRKYLYGNDYKRHHYRRYFGRCALTIGDSLDVAPQTAPIFLSIGMHCLGCPSSRGETVEEACMVHGVDVEKLLALVNEEANKAAE